MKRSASSGPYGMVSGCVATGRGRGDVVLVGKMSTLFGSNIDKMGSADLTGLTNAFEAETTGRAFAARGSRGSRVILGGPAWVAEFSSPAHDVGFRRFQTTFTNPDSGRV